MKVTPQKLSAGDEVRIIAPAFSITTIDEKVRKLAEQRLTALGLNVTYGEHVEECDEFDSSSIESRVSDLHDAFQDSNVKAILTAMGCFNSSDLLPHIDYELIKQNPKIFCGFSDITALNTAIYTKADLVTYSGAHFFTFGMLHGLEYTSEYFKKCFFNNTEYIVEPAAEWSDDEWWIAQEDREYITNDGYNILAEGRASGKSLGGNLATLNLLQGTSFMPDLTGAVLFLEDDAESNVLTFNRDLRSLVQSYHFREVKGLVLGRFQKKSKVQIEQLAKLLRQIEELQGIPIVANANFGHTDPIFTFPIGGKVEVEAINSSVSLKFIR